MSIPSKQILLLAILLTTGCVGFHSGIRHIDPPGNKIVPSPTVKSLNPTLSWEAYKEEGVENLSYQLVISKYDQSNYVTAYDRLLRDTSHKVEVSLEPHTRYYWRVRPIYRKDDREFAGSWNGFPTSSLSRR